MGRAENEARRLLDETGQNVPLPVDVTAVAEHVGAQVVEERLDREVSGLLYRDGDQAIIGVNSLHAERRRRFTIAHEIGHLVLHQGRPLVMDHVRVNYRDATSSTATDTEEIQANAFAAELLMPAANMIQDMWGLMKASKMSEAAILSTLADQYDVSEQAMEYRLINLGLRRQV
jgi:Zn-dependent peptidase ImmA (M78 family)